MVVAMTDTQTAIAWLRTLAQHIEHGATVSPAELRWCAVMIEQDAPKPLRRRVSWWRRWMMPRRRIV
jgi:hypothetical protein